MAGQSQPLGISFTLGNDMSATPAAHLPVELETVPPASPPNPFGPFDKDKGFSDDQMELMRKYLNGVLGFATGDGENGALAVRVDKFPDLSLFDKDEQLRKDSRRVLKRLIPLKEESYLISVTRQGAVIPSSGQTQDQINAQIIAVLMMSKNLWVPANSVRVEITDPAMQKHAATIFGIAARMGIAVEGLTVDGLNHAAWCQKKGLTPPAQQAQTGQAPVDGAAPVLRGDVTETTAPTTPVVEPPVDSAAPVPSGDATETTAPPTTVVEPPAVEPPTPSEAEVPPAAADAQATPPVEPAAAAGEPAQSSSNDFSNKLAGEYNSALSDPNNLQAFIDK